MPNKKSKQRIRILHGLALVVLGPLASRLALGLIVEFQESPVSLSTMPYTWAYYLGMTAIPMIFGLILITFVRPVYGWLIYALGSAFMLYGQATLAAMPSPY